MRYKFAHNSRELAYVINFESNCWSSFFTVARGGWFKKSVKFLFKRQIYQSRMKNRRFLLLQQTQPERINIFLNCVREKKRREFQFWNIIIRKMQTHNRYLSLGFEVSPRCVFDKFRPVRLICVAVTSRFISISWFIRKTLDRSA